ncbi:rCG27285 [Rattus norvegicus]|uniref:RCG27285 n=1 Tax=Rattus norvegicus TaxID=10116 RepID=A6HMC1_RAT|nr:rCG27285 [Rattus norvegicus]
MFQRPCLFRCDELSLWNCKELTQDYQPRDDTTHNGLGLPPSITEVEISAFFGIRNQLYHLMFF